MGGGLWRILPCCRLIKLYEFMFLLLLSVLSRDIKVYVAVKSSKTAVRVVYKGLIERKSRPSVMLKGHGPKKLTQFGNMSTRIIKASE